MSPPPSSASVDVWKTFVLSRFGSPDDTSRPASTRTAQLDHELEIMQDPHILVLAKRRRNDSLLCCTLPHEVLSRVMWFAQAAWSPERSFPSGEVSLGWIVVTHVCNSWREVALSSSSLWCDIRCYALPVSAVPALIERSRQRRLKLSFFNYPDGDAPLESKMSALRQLWLSQPIRTYARELIIRDTVSRWSSRSWAQYLRHHMPKLQEVRITLHARGQRIGVILPDDFLGPGSLPTALDTVVLANCYLPWTSHLFGAGIKVLDLTMKLPEETAPPPSATQFHDALSRLTNLETLSLHNVFPTFSDSRHPIIELPASLGVISLVASVPYLASRAVKTLQCMALPIDTRCELDLFHESDTSLISDALSHLFLLPPLPPSELLLSSVKIVTLLSEEWISGSPEYGPHGIDRPMQYRSEKRLSVQNRHEETPGMELLSLLHLIRMHTLTRLAITSDAIQLFSDVEVWKTTFAAASEVSCLALSHTPELFHLLCALTETVTDAGSETFALFPRLKVITFNRDVALDSRSKPRDASDVEAAQLRLALLNLLLARQRTGVSLDEVRAEAGILGQEEKQRIAEIVSVRIFEEL
ncbi:unnamed protein product [Peniophora sp. CBMAI 1063]|nr:unnamed protein product [Peniophora sp. CBMAI 1063]